jgi:hypothetical protein
MSNKDLFLELGDIIQINAPSNTMINNHIYFIDYIDKNIVILIDDKNLEKKNINIDESGKLDDETIESIAILSKSEKKGYAKQNNLIINNWVSIHIGGDIPTIITGQITDLEEDMIEINTWPDNEKIYIDFGYQGIPLDIPFEKFVLRQEPPKTTLLEETSNIILKEEEEKPDIEIRLKEQLLEGDEIEFGEELEEITEVINVPIEEKRYDIQTQENDILDDLLSSIPVIERTKTVINNIHTMINRFGELREIFSDYNEYGVPLSIKKIDKTPLITSLKKLNKKLNWILPVAKNKKKIYDIEDEEDDFEDVLKINLRENIENINNFFEQYEQNSVPDGQNKYFFLSRQINDFLTPFEKPFTNDNVLKTIEIDDNLNVIIENFGYLDSTCVKGINDIFQVETSQFCITKYILGMNILKVSKTADFKTKSKLVKLTKNDDINIVGFIIFPQPIIQYSKINLPKTNICVKANYNLNYISYSKILKSVKNKIEDIEITNSQKNIYDETKFAGKVQFIKMEDAGDNYEKFLNMIIPNISYLLENNIKKDQTLLSFSKVLNKLEPFLIYENNITYSDYKKILIIIRKQIAECKKKCYRENKINDLYSKFDYNIDKVKSDILVNDDLRNIYSLDENNNSIALKKITMTDSGKTFMTYLSLEDIDLHSTINIEETVEANLKVAESKEKVENEKNTCKNFILTKEYFDVKDLTNDDGKENIFFDKKYDITHYEILEEFKLEQATLSPEEFKIFMINHFTKNVGMSIDEADKEYNAIISMRRKIMEGQYAIINDSIESKIYYYKRIGNQWVLDETIQDKELDDVFCNLRSKCLKINKKCNNNDLTKAQLNKKILKEMLNHFDKDFYISKEQLTKELGYELDYHLKNIKMLKRSQDFEFFKYDIHKYLIALTLEEGDEIIKSPHEELRDAILGQNDFVKKQNDIIIFTNKYCREDENDKNWYYCIETNIKLLPTFYKRLADSYTLKNYLKELNLVCKERGTISDDNNYIVDKHSGFIIRNIEFDISEGYETSGFKKLSREIIEEDISEIIMRQIKPEETIDPNINKIKNIIKHICGHMGISIGNEETFIINNVSNSLNNESYLPSYKKKLQSKSGKKMKPYEFVYDDYLLFYTLCYLLVCILTAIPSIRSKKTFPGCKKSFEGFPLINDKSDMGAVNYLSCIVYKTKSNNGVWRVLVGKKQESIQKKILILLEKKILKRENIKNKIKFKNESHETQNIISFEHNIQRWTTFLPPLQFLKIPRVRDLGAGFVNSLKSNIKSGDKEQFNQLDEIRGKIIYFSLKIQECIQDVIIKEHPLLNDSNNIPFIENVCCNEGCKNVLKYFIDKDRSIGDNNEKVYKLSQTLYKFLNLSKAILLYSPLNTKMIYPALEDIFSEDTIYHAFIYYCEFNSMRPLSEDMLGLCLNNTSNITELDTFPQKIKKLKDEGKIFTNAHLIELLTIIAKRNIIPNDNNYDIVHAHQELIQVIHFLKERDDANVSLKLLSLLESLTDSFDVLDWGKSSDPENKIVDNLKNYLHTANNELKISFINFMKENGKIKKDIKKITTFLDNINNWNPRGNNFYMESEDETCFFGYTFLKQATIDMCEVFPNIITNKVDYKDVKIPQHWKISDFHKGDIQKIINKEFKTFTEFYNADISTFLDNIKNKTVNLLLLMKTIPFFSKINGADTIFDCSILKVIGEFFFLSALEEYTKIDYGISLPIKKDEGEYVTVDSIKRDEMGIETELEILEGENQEKTKEISNLLFTYISVFANRKKMLNINNDEIKERILKIKEKEKNRLTKRYKDLTDEERKVEKIQQNHRLGDWNLGQTKALHQYSTIQFDKEREVIMKTALEERKIGETDEITQMLGSVFSMEDVHDMDMKSRRNAENAVQMSLLGDDDDFGDNDGDETY